MLRTMLSIAAFALDDNIDLRCSMALIGPRTRPPVVSYATLRATPDSVSDGEYFSAAIERRPEYPGQRPRTVYGQVFEVVSAEGPGADALLARRRALIVWWTRGMSCERYYPRAAIFVPVGEIIALRAPRPEQDWVSGIPTIDMIELSEDLYPPREAFLRPTDTGRPRQSFTEFLDMYRQFPTAAALAEDARAALEPLLRWGAADSVRWYREPSRSHLCEALKSRTFDRSPRCPGDPK